LHLSSEKLFSKFAFQIQLCTATVRGEFRVVYVTPEKLVGGGGGDDGRAGTFHDVILQ
jgi:hypothetical protein